MDDNAKVAILTIIKFSFRCQILCDALDDEISTIHGFSKVSSDDIIVLEQLHSAMSVERLNPSSSSLP